MALPDSTVRADIEAAIREGYSGEFLTGLYGSSAALSALPIKTLTSKQTKFSTRSDRPIAGWDDDTTNAGDAAIIKKSSIAWSYNTAVAEGVSVIVGVHKDSIEDADEDVLKETTLEGAAALANVVDDAVFFGNNKPSTWLSSHFMAAATAADQVYEVESLTAQDLYGAHLIAASTTADKGVNLRGVAAQPSLRWKLANERDADNRLLLSGVSLPFETTFGDNPAWADASDDVVSFMFDPRHVRIGIRKRLEVEFTDSAAVTAPDGTVQTYWDRHMYALKFRMRIGYVIDNGLTSRGIPASPVAAIVPAGEGY